VPKQVLGRKIRECVKPPGRVATEHALALGCQSYMRASEASS
jgi:hypothetical protein